MYALFVTLILAAFTAAMVLILNRAFDDDIQEEARLPLFIDKICYYIGEE